MSQTAYNAHRSKLIRSRFPWAIVAIFIAALALAMGIFACTQTPVAEAVNDSTAGLTALIVSPSDVVSGETSSVYLNVKNSGAEVTNGHFTATVTPAMVTGLTYWQGDCAVVADLDKVVYICDLPSPFTGTQQINTTLDFTPHFTGAVTVTLSAGTSNVTAVMNVVAHPNDSTADIIVQHEVTPTLAYPGQVVSLTTYVASVGPSDATDVVITNTIVGPGFTTGTPVFEVPVGVTHTYTQIGNQIRLTLSRTPYLFITKIVVPVYFTGAGEFTSTAVAAAAEADPNPADNTAEAEGEIAPWPFKLYLPAMSR